MLYLIAFISAFGGGWLIRSATRDWPLARTMQLQIGIGLTLVMWTIILSGDMTWLR